MKRPKRTELLRATCIPILKRLVVRSRRPQETTPDFIRYACEQEAKRRAKRKVGKDRVHSI